MKQLLSLTILACVFSIHSAKQETNQRQLPDTAPIKNKEQHKKRSFSKKTLFSLDETPTANQSSPFSPFGYESNTQPLFANRLQEDRKKLNVFVTKIDFTRDGIGFFLNQTFNNQDYSTEFLPYSFTHLVQFLDFGHTSGQPLEFVEGAFRLFNQKLKSCSYVSAPGFERFMTQATPYLEHHLAQQQLFLWQDFKTILAQTFKEKISFAKQDPLGFFDYLSKNLATKVATSVTTPDRVRSTLLRLLAQGTDKIIWCPDDEEATWHSFKTLGAAFQNLHTKKVIPDELDVNELYWSLVERYCHFLKLGGTQLSLATCTIIKNDLASKSVPWLLHKEQEALLETKLDRLALAVLEAETKIHAGKQGIITDILPHQKRV